MSAIAAAFLGLTHTFCESSVHLSMISADVMCKCMSLLHLLRDTIWQASLQLLTPEDFDLEIVWLAQLLAGKIKILK